VRSREIHPCGDAPGMARRLCQVDSRCLVRAVPDAGEEPGSTAAQRPVAESSSAIDRPTSPLDKRRRMTAVGDRSVAGTGSTRPVWKPQPR
jgi:hypothetical protein